MLTLMSFLLALLAVTTAQSCGRGQAPVVTMESLRDGATQSDGGIIQMFEVRNDTCSYARGHITIRLTLNDHITSLKTIKLLHRVTRGEDRILLELKDRNRPVIVHFMAEEFQEFDIAFYDDRIVGENARYCVSNAPNQMVEDTVYDFFWVAD